MPPLIVNISGIHRCAVFLLCLKERLFAAAIFRETFFPAALPFNMKPDYVFFPHTHGTRGTSVTPEGLFSYSSSVMSRKCDCILASLMVGCRPCQHLFGLK